MLLGFVICVLLLIAILILPMLVGPQIYNNDLFRQISVVVVALIVAFLTFGLLSGSTAGVRMNPIGGLAISLGGAAAAVFAFYYVISNRLTPTTHMVVFAQSSGQSLPGDVRLTGDQMTARQIITIRQGRGEFQILARGQSTALELESAKWKISSISPPDCKDLNDSRPYVVKAGCDQITLDTGPTTVHLVDYTAAQTYNTPTVSLQFTIEQLREGAAAWIHARDNTIPVTVDWKVGEDIKNAELQPKSNSTEVSLCVLLSDLQNAFNDSNPSKRVKLVVSKTTIEIDPWTEGQSHDDCARTP